MTTYLGTTISVANGLPAANTEEAFAELDFVSGACALWECPPLARQWGVGKESLACRSTDFEYKTSATWDHVPVKFSDIPSDAAQSIYESLEGSSGASGSFKLTLPLSRGSYYFTAQVLKFSLLDGGNKEAIQTRSGVLLIQSYPVFVEAPFYAPAMRVDTTSYTVDSTVFTVDRTEAV